MLESSYYRFNNTSIVIDLGMYYTKIGISANYAPIKIIKTPINLFLTNNTFKSDNKFLNIYNCNNDGFNENIFLDNLYDFFEDIFINHLLINQKDKVLTLGLNTLFSKYYITEISKILIDKFNIKKLILVNNLLTPLYITGNYSGVIVDIGFTQISVLAVYNGLSIKETFKYTRKSGLYLFKKLYKLILKKYDNFNELNDEELSFILNDIIIKYGFIPSRYQKESYLSNNENIQKMKDHVIQYKFKNRMFSINYYIIFKLGNFLFKGSDAITYIILEAILSIPNELKAFLCTNILITGSLAMIPKFTQRLREDLVHIIKHEYNNIFNLLGIIKFNDLKYPAFSSSWCGACFYNLLITEKNDNYISKDNLTTSAFNIINNTFNI